MTFRHYLGIFILAAGCLFIGQLIARWSSNDIDPEEVHDMLRAAGDSAVTEFRDGDGMKEFVAGQLADTVKHYEAEVEAAAVVEVERDTVRIVRTVTTVDTVRVVSTVGDTATVELVPVVQSGMTLRDTLKVAPRPTFLERWGTVTFDPDSVVVALLRTPEGVQRFTAAARGMSVTVVDAAERRVGRANGLRKVLEVGTAAACLVSGFLAGDGRTRPALAVGAGCLGGLGIGFLTR